MLKILPRMRLFAYGIKHLNGKIKTFLPKPGYLRVSYNLYIDTLRKRKTGSLNEQKHAITSSTYAEENLYEAQADFQQQIQALKRQCSVITLCAYNGLSNQEAAN